MSKELYDRIDAAERGSKSVLLKPGDLMLIRKALLAADADNQRSFEDAILRGSKKGCACGRGLAGPTGMCDQCFLSRDTSHGSIQRHSARESNES